MNCVTTPTKTCSCCLEDLLLSEFAMKYPQRGVLHSRCRQCQRATSRAHYLRNAKKIKQKSAVNRRGYQDTNRAFVNASLKGKYCALCGSSDEKELGYKVNPDYEGPRVSAVLSQGLGQLTLMESIANSTIVCKPCEHVAAATVLVLYNTVRRDGVVVPPNPVSRADQKKVHTKSSLDLRRDRALRPAGPNEKPA